MEAETKKYPFDFDELKKGDYIPPERCEEILRMSREDRAYGLKMMHLKSQIENELADRGRVVTVAQVKSGLKILTDSEASVYNESELHNSIRKLRRSHKRTMHVDVTNLTDDEKREHERRILASGFYVTGIADAAKKVRKITHEPHERDKPLLMT